MWTSLRHLRAVVRGALGRCSGFPSRACVALTSFLVVQALGIGAALAATTCADINGGVFNASMTNRLASTPVTFTAGDVVTMNYTFQVDGTGEYGMELDVASQYADAMYTASGTVTLTVAATGSQSFRWFALDDGGVSQVTVSFTCVSLAPVAHPVAATVAYGSGANAIPLNITGGTATSVAVSVAAAHGTATASGTSITYTPTAGYAGSDSFSYTASNSTGISGAALASITVSTPTLTIAPTSGTALSGTAGTAFRQTFTAAGGIGPYTFADLTITSGVLPTGLRFDTATGTLAGTPTSAGTVSFTVAVTDSSTGSGPFSISGTYTLTVAGLPPIANAVAATVAYGSSNNAITLNITGGAATSVAVSTSASHGTATASGTSISYTPAPGYAGPDSFTYLAANAVGVSAAATVSITVTPTTLTMSPASGANFTATQGAAFSQTFVLSGGKSPYAFASLAIGSGSLPAGLSFNPATGTLSGTPTAAGSVTFTVSASDSSSGSGPFTVSGTYTLAVQSVGPTVTRVSPNAGPVAGQQTAVVTGTRLAGATSVKFGGNNVVSFTVDSATQITVVTPAHALGSVDITVTTPSGTATGANLYAYTAMPNPALDPTVQALVDFQVHTVQVMGQQQIDNMQDRLTDLHTDDVPLVSQNAAIALPYAAQLTEPGAQMDADLPASAARALDAKRARGQTVDPASTPKLDLQSPLRFWTAGSLQIGQDTTYANANYNVVTTGLTAGVDTRLSPDLKAGIAGGIGFDHATIGTDGSHLNANLVSVGIYGSYRLAPRWFLDGLVGYAGGRLGAYRYDGSAFSIATGNRAASDVFGSLSVTNDLTIDRWKISPYARLDWQSLRLNAYAESGAGIYNLTYNATSSFDLAGAIGAKFKYSIDTAMGLLKPNVELAYRHSFSGAYNQTIFYTALPGTTYNLSGVAEKSDQALFGFGADLDVNRQLTIGAQFGASVANHATSESGRVRVVLRY